MTPIEEIKQRLSIVDVVGQYVSLKKSGRNYKGLCPLHGEKTPSFMVSEELGIFKCFGCFVEGTLVKTPAGYKPIETIMEGDEVISGNGNIRKVLHTHRREYSGNLISLRTKMLSMHISPTEDHEILVLGQGYTRQYKYLSKRMKIYQKLNDERSVSRIKKYFPVHKIPSSELRKGDCLLYPIPAFVKDIENINLWENYTKILPKHGSKPKEINTIISLEKDFLELVGWYLAEGSTHRAYIRFSFGPQEKREVYEVYRICKRLFNLKGGIHKRTKGHSGLELTICNSFLSNVFGNLFGKSAEDKRLPYAFTLLPPEKQEFILRSYWRGDGHSSKRNFKHTHSAKTVTTTSRILSLQIRDILLRLGFFPCENIQISRKDQHGVNHKESYRVNWYRNVNDQRYNLTYTDENLRKYWILPVSKIDKKPFKGIVYNLHIDSDNSYIAGNVAVGNCGKAGDIFKFVQEIEGLEFPQALKVLADKAGVHIENEYEDKFAKKKKILYEINHLSSEFYHYLLLKHKAGKIGYSYFVDKRHLSLKTIQEFKLGFAPKGWNLLYQYLSKKKYAIEDMLDAGVVVKINTGEGYIDKFRNRVVFPLTDIDGKIVGFAGRSLGEEQPKYLNTSETLVFHKSQFIYGLDKARLLLKNGTAVFVEGYMDVISAHQEGYKNFIASSGTSLTQSQLKIVARYTKDLIFCFDTDSAGINATYRAVELAEKEGLNVKIAALPAKYKDIDEFIMNDRKEVETVLANSIPVYDFYLAAALKKYDKTNAIGKKKIVEELTPFYSKITNKVTFNHYIKVLSEELGIDQTVLNDLFTRKTTDSAEDNTPVFNDDAVLDTYRKAPEAYMLALLFKAPLDNIETFMYVDGQNTLNEKYFSNDVYKELYKRFTEFLSGVKERFDIKYFSGSLPEELQKSAEELYLWDLDYVAGDDKLLRKELESSFQRLKGSYVKKKRLEISQKIKQAELEKNDKLVRDLTKEFNELL